MLFNSFQFLFFFVLITVVYYKLPHKDRWKLLLASSYYFYMCWRPAYIVLIITSTLIAYVCGLQMGRTDDRRRKRVYLLLSLFTSLGLLVIFKYLNFFGWTVKWFLGCSPAECAQPILDVLLPVGISFYTFQTLSYTIDVYRGIQKPEKRLGIFALYVSFFPQLVAGPIERSTRLMPQFDQIATFDYHRVTDGLKLMLWGMFKKVVIADTLSQFVEPVYSDPLSFSGPSFVVATLFFTFQIYCDFSGYSDIAIGSANVLGIDLMKNFDRPYFSKSVGEFWRRWHISLSTWFRDYLYIPLGGNRCRPGKQYLNLTIVFLICGLWHGANWTFVIWGLLHGSCIATERLTAKWRESATERLKLNRVPWLHQFVRVAMTFIFVSFAWIFFRARNLSDAWYIVSHLFTGWETVFQSHNYQPIFILGSARFFITALLLIALMESIHLLQKQRTICEMINQSPLWIRWPAYYFFILAILFLGNFNSQEFIYFQF